MDADALPIRIQYIPQHIYIKKKEANKFVPKSLTKRQPGVVLAKPQTTRIIKMHMENSILEFRTARAVDPAGDFTHTTQQQLAEQFSTQDKNIYMVGFTPKTSWIV